MNSGTLVLNGFYKLCCILMVSLLNSCCILMVSINSGLLAEEWSSIDCAQRSLGKVDGKILLRSDPSVKKAPKNQAVSQVILHGIAGSLRASVHSPGESSECTQATL